MTSSLEGEGGVCQKMTNDDMMTNDKTQMMTKPSTKEFKFAVRLTILGNLIIVVILIFIFIFFLKLNNQNILILQIYAGCKLIRLKEKYFNHF